MSFSPNFKPYAIVLASIPIRPSGVEIAYRVYYVKCAVGWICPRHCLLCWISSFVCQVDWGLCEWRKYPLCSKVRMCSPSAFSPGLISALWNEFRTMNGIQRSNWSRRFRKACGNELFSQKVNFYLQIENLVAPSAIIISSWLECKSNTESTQTASLISV